jgi:hypothetical protein
MCYAISERYDELKNVEREVISPYYLKGCFEN